MLAKGQVVAVLAPQTGKGFAHGMGAVGIKDLATMAALRLLLLGKAFGTGSFSIVNCVLGFIAAGDKGFGIFEFGSMREAKLVSDLCKGMGLQSCVSDCFEEYLDALVREKSHYISYQDIFRKDIQQCAIWR